PRVLPDIDCFFPDIDIPLRANGLVDVLEVIKSAVRTFDQKTIALGSSRSYKTVLELIATGSVSTLEKHFKQVFKYADKLRPLEVWIIHFSREDSIVSNLSSNNNSLETNPKDSTKVSKEETKSRGYDSSNLNISEISSEAKSPTSLLSNQKIPYNQKVERG
ncbi:10787_t:CDS:2, partial [Racocetra fulgida]